MKVGGVEIKSITAFKPAVMVDAFSPSTPGLEVEESV